MRASLRSVIEMACSTPLLPRNEKWSFAPLISTCRPRSVVRPNERLSRAYSSLPTRISVLSSSITTVARIWRRVRSRAHVALDALADLRKDLAELEHAAEFRRVARVAVQRVVAVLLATARVAGGGLDVAVRVRADPHVGPRGWDHQAVDALALRGVPDLRAVGRIERPTLACALARDAGDAVGDVGQAGTGGGLAVLVDSGRDHRPAV